MCTHSKNTIGHRAGAIRRRQLLQIHQTVIRLTVQLRGIATHTDENPTSEQANEVILGKFQIKTKKNFAAVDRRAMNEFVLFILANRI